MNRKVIAERLTAALNQRLMEVAKEGVIVWGSGHVTATTENTPGRSRIT